MFKCKRGFWVHCIDFHSVGRQHQDIPVELELSVILQCVLNFSLGGDQRWIDLRSRSINTEYVWLKTVYVLELIQ